MKPPLRSIIARSVAAASLLVFVIAASGCMDVLNFYGDLFAGVIAASNDDIYQQEPEPLSSLEPDEPSPTPFFINPLNDFYKSFILETEPGFCEFRGKLAEHGGTNALKYSLLLDAHMINLSRIFTTVGRLFSDGEPFYYSGNVFGADAGTGTIWLNEDGIYEFSYTFSASSNKLTGTFSENSLQFAIASYETTVISGGSEEEDDTIETAQTVLMRASIEKTDGVWTSSVWEESQLSELCFSDNPSFAAKDTVIELIGGDIIYSSAVSTESTEESAGE